MAKPLKRRHISIYVKIAIPLVLALVLIQVLIATAVFPLLRPPPHHHRMLMGIHGPGFPEFKGMPPMPLPPFHRPPNPVMSLPFWVILSSQVATVLIFCYLILAWQLRPIKKLNRAVDALSNGDLDHRINLKDSGEFGQLADGFDQMAARLSNMIKAKEELLLGVSHELRSPLASVNVQIEMIKDAKRRKQIRTQLMRMESLVGQILESQRVTHAHPRFTAVSVSNLLERMREVYEASGSRLSFHFPEPSLAVELDERQFESLLSNLIDNALKYSPKTKAIRISATDMGNEVRFDVADSGPGIPEKDLPNVFEPFYRVDKSRNRDTGGFGLGLHLCARITAHHRGRIWVQNLPKTGCCFSVQIPKSQG